MNKKGIELSINVIIIAALGLLIVAILAVLIINGNNENKLRNNNQTTINLSSENTETTIKFTSENPDVLQENDTNCCNPWNENSSCEENTSICSGIIVDEPKWEWSIIKPNISIGNSFTFSSNGSKYHLIVTSTENYTNYTITIDNNYFKTVPCNYSTENMDNENYTCYMER